jgi:hypothetical protein
MGHILLNENTAFGHLERDSDNETLEKLDLVFQFIDSIDERIKIRHTGDEAAKGLISIKLSLDGLLDIVRAKVRATVKTNPHFICRTQDLPSNICIRVKLFGGSAHLRDKLFKL